MTAPGPDDASLALLAEESPAMLWRGDTTGRCVFLSRAMREFWGLGPDDCGRFDWSSSLLAEDQGAVFGPFSEGMSARGAIGGRTARCGCCRRGPGPITPRMAALPA